MLPIFEKCFAVQAEVVDRIKSASPRDIPVERPTRFEPVINVKTATVLGLTIPQTLLLRTNQIIE